MEWNDTMLIERMSIAYWNAADFVPRWKDESEDQRQMVRRRMAAALEAMRAPIMAQPDLTTS